MRGARQFMNRNPDTGDCRTFRCMEIANSPWVWEFPIMETVTTLDAPQIPRERIAAAVGADRDSR